MRQRQIWAWIVGLAIIILFLGPRVALADNCSSLHDCWGGARAIATTAAAWAAAAAGLVVGAVSDWIRDKIESFIPSAYKQASDRVKDAAQAAADEQSVFEEIGRTVQYGLETGELPPRGDAGLGETRQNFTPDEGLPFDPPPAPVPGISVPGAGRNRHQSGQQTPQAGSGSHDRSPGPPLGSSGIGEETPPPETDDNSTTTPSPEDLGLDPNGNVEIRNWPDGVEVTVVYSDGTQVSYRYSPDTGRVVINHADGTTETRSWP